MVKNDLNGNIPKIVGILIITIAILFTIILVTKGNIFQIKAGPGQDPRNVEITNVLDDSFTVSFITNDKVFGTINYGENSSNLDAIALDDRDQLNQIANKYYLHSITVRNLKPLNTYYFVILSGDKKYSINSTPYETTTGSIIKNDPLSQNPISGNVILPNGIVPSEGLVYVEIPGAQKISSLIKNDGIYMLPLNGLRNSNLDHYYSLNQNQLIKIIAKSSKMFSSILISPNQINPVPQITLSSGNNFSSNFTPTPIPTQNVKQTYQQVSNTKKINNTHDLQIPTEIIKPTQIEPSTTPILNDSSLTNKPDIFSSISLFLKNKSNEFFSTISNKQ
jgi:hypothetical protein